MIVIDCEQGSDEWWQARIGMPTASEFNKILTPAKLEYSKQADGYMYKLLGEWLRGKPDETFTSEWMNRGHEFEPEARDFYELREDVQQVGFCVYKDCGCSPDGLVGEDGGLEIKCPSPGVMVRYMMQQRVPTEYRLQIAGALYVTGRKWWDFLAYHPDLPPVLIRTMREEMTKEISALEAALSKFTHDMYNQQVKLIERGFKPHDQTPAD